MQKKGGGNHLSVWNYHSNRLSCCIKGPQVCVCTSGYRLYGTPPYTDLDWASDLLWPLANNKSESEKFDMFVLTGSLKLDIAYCVL